MNTDDLNYFEARFKEVRAHTTAEVDRHASNPCKNSAKVKQQLTDHKEKDHKRLTLWQVITTVIVFLGGLVAVDLALKNMDKGG